MSLYNELRPVTLSGVVGQNTVKQLLLGMFSAKRIPNAMLFIGPRGTGKTTVARIVARTLNCEHGGAEPCGKCSSCRSILDGSSFDVIELDAASNNGVDDVKEIVGTAQYVPLSKYRVIILDEVHVFSSTAWNALLKILEEPPENTLFIMCTTEEHKVPKTIVSRSRKMQFEALSLDMITSYLARVCETNGKEYEMDALKLISIASEGGMRDALSIMEPFYDSNDISTATVAETLGLSQDSTVFNILNAVRMADALTAISEVRNVSKKGMSMQLLLKSLIMTLTEAIFLKNGTGADNLIATEDHRRKLVSYVSEASLNDIMNLSKCFCDAYGTMLKTPNHEFFLETILLSAIMRPYDPEKYLKLENRVDALERKLGESNR